MTVTQTPGAIKKFRRTPWRFQQTVEIPQGSDEPEQFAAAIAAAHGDMREATVIINQVVFDTLRITSLLPTPANQLLIKDTSFSAAGDEALALLTAALVDGPDFVFIPNPKPFVCYADHDQWITFCSNTKSQLNHIIEPLASRGYKLVQDWQREF
jgi:hypothetical protein